jgi:probable rRNA maturation factor
MEIETIFKTKKIKGIEKPFIEKIAKRTLAASGKKIAAFFVSIVFVDKAEIRKINRKYRKINKSTDILSFDYSLGYNKKRKAIAGGLPAEVSAKTGELLLCPEVIEESAKKNKVSFQKELAFVLAHGVLHLLGFRHGKKMFDLQDKIAIQIRE